MKLSELKLNEENPRKIRDSKLESLKKSISDFKKMMSLRPIVIDEKNKVLGGNMRVRALKALGYKEIPDEWIKKAIGLTEKEKQEFIAKDNIGFGEWDWELLLNGFDADELTEWGLDVPEWGDIEKLEQIHSEEEEWIGLPEFEPKEDSFKIIIHFENEDIREKYARNRKMKFLIKQSRAWITWHPHKSKEDLSSLKYE